GRSTRIGDIEEAHRGVPVAGFRFGVPSQVACPIVVEGSLWGVITLNAPRELPPDTEQRLEKFIELVTTAIANAEAGIALRAAAEEQGALRRVATLVAEDLPPGELFRAVTLEGGTLLGADFSGMARLADGAVLPLAGWAAEGEHPPLPDRWPMQPGDPVTEIAGAQRSVRWDDWTTVPGPIAAFIRDELKVHSSAGTPIFVDDQLWGVLAVHSKQLLAQDSVSRLEKFSDLVATALSNAEARAEVARLADEQAALRRVATLVATQARHEEVYTAIVEGVGSVLDEELRLVRYENDHAIVVAGSEGPRKHLLPVGSRIRVGGNNA